MLRTTRIQTIHSPPRQARTTLQQPIKAARHKQSHPTPPHTRNPGYKLKNLLNSTSCYSTSIQRLQPSAVMHARSRITLSNECKKKTRMKEENKEIVFLPPSPRKLHPISHLCTQCNRTVERRTANSQMFDAAQPKEHREPAALQRSRQPERMHLQQSQQHSNKNAGSSSKMRYPKPYTPKQMQLLR